MHLVPPKILMASKDRVNDKWQSRNQDDAAAAAASAWGQHAKKCACTLYIILSTWTAWCSKTLSDLAITLVGVWRVRIEHFLS